MKHFTSTSNLIPLSVDSTVDLCIGDQFSLDTKIYVVMDGTNIDDRCRNCSLEGDCSCTMIACGVYRNDDKTVYFKRL